MSEDALTALSEVVEKEEVERATYSEQAKQVRRLLDEVKGTGGEPFVIRDDGDFEWATELLNHAKLEQKRIDKTRKTVTEPLRQALEAFRAIYRPTLQGWEQIEKLLKKKLGDYTLQKKREEEKAMREIAEASQEGDFDKAMEVSNKMQTAPEDKRMTVKRVWYARVVDIDKVPDEFVVKSLNAGAIATHIQKAKGAKPKEIPGVVFEERSSVTMRAK